MSVSIKILCPGRKCGKCHRMIVRVDEAVKSLGIKADIEIVDKIDEMLKYQTWILPTLIVNDVIIARGYVPSIEIIQKQLIGITING